MPSRLPFIDALKALAAQLIVLHHLAFYGPMSDHAHALAPDAISWLSQEARYAVQVFLVLGGFLAVQSLAPAGCLRVSEPLGVLWKRYCKLASPYLVALLVALLSAAISRALMAHDSLPAPPSVPQVLAHVFLLQSVLGHEGLSAGVWYIAIDFQLFALLLGLLWLARQVAVGAAREAAIAACLVAALAVASLLHFNRDAEWDSWGVYFFGSYALGVASYWATNGRPRRAACWLAPVVAVVLLTLLVEYRPRIAVALVVALALALARLFGVLEGWPKSHLIGYLGRTSYSLFLVHFPVCLLVNALFSRFARNDPWFNLVGLVVAWLLSMAAAALFYRYVEAAMQGTRRRHPALAAVRPGS
ncbi:MAG: Acyltransferase family protein [Candidatus Accumulibacter adjunctus]|uniref:Acyltransferase family protein n=1 Tax=Candidatus Accumulibacter adjunctus TaxID=1454001 RepID=A0A011MDF5_9PROT|nr:MAG: Acyltransferase family protein [Candidatus Accumulibacter adjunctus]